MKLRQETLGDGLEQNPGYLSRDGLFVITGFCADIIAQACRKYPAGCIHLYQSIKRLDDFLKNELS